jgi:uncharacterized membrane protein YraQ (UPF0718 family)
MQKLKQKLKLLSLTLLTLAALAAPISVMAATDPCHPENNNPPGQPLTQNQLQSCEACNQTCLSNSLQKNPIVRDLDIIVNFLSGLVGIVVVGTLILGGIQYSMAGDSPDAVGKAKQRITNALLALVAFLLIFAFLQWIIPGGVFN